MQETHRQSATVPRPFWRLPDGARSLLDRRAPTDDSQTVCDGAKTVSIPAGDSQTVPDSYPDRLGTCRRLTDSRRRCEDPLGTCRRLEEVAISLPDRRGTCMRLKNSLRRCQNRLSCKRLPDGAKQCHRPSGHLRESPKQSGLQETPRRCQTVSQTVRAPAGFSQTVCDGAKTVMAPAGDSQTVPDSLPDRRDTCRRLPDNLRRC
ncbi:hypothetical protein DPMN_109299 [Dreissena polymorpha]|uniref:Uncharacterized protein n=1 Tax=Dreissena polymorpha TaxID=45954 RepID=A0A9D4KAF4_DREPO|nr:hypothetical protein DPMN_109299 [Dreissena polymorpha]